MTVMERPSSAGEAICAVRSLLAEAVGCPLWSMDDGELAALVVQAGAVVAQAQAVLLGLVGEADARGVLLGDGAPSAPAWLRHRLRISPAEAAAYLQTARGLHTDLGHTAAACAAGTIGLGHAAVITRTIGDLPAERALRRDAERELVADAAMFDPVVLSRLGRRLLTVVDPDGVDTRDGHALARAEQRAARRMDLSISPDGDGGSWLRGRLDPAGTAVVRAALDPLAAPRPSTADGPDRRSPGRRRADALVEVCRRVLAHGDLPDTGGDRPQVIVTIPLAVLQQGVGAGTLDDGTAISAAEARRLACDAKIIPAVLGGPSEILDLGRSRRLFTGGLRRTLALRDRGCAFPGCDRPPAWCDAHHITAWAAGGETTLHNGVLLCAHHHRLVEHGHWDVALAADGIPEFHPPPWIDPHRQPRRNHMHRRE